MKVNVFSMIPCKRGFWFVDNRCPYLFFHEKEHNNTEAICILTEEKTSGIYFSQILMYKNLIFAIPFSIHHLCVYRIDNNTVTTIDVFNDMKKANISISSDLIFFERAEIFDNKLFLFGKYCPCIYVLDLVTWDSSIIVEPYNEMNRIIPDQLYFYRIDFPILEGVCYIPLFCSNYLLVFDMSTYKFEIIHIDSNPCGYLGGVVVNNLLVLLDKEGYIIEVDMNSYDTIKTINCQVKDVAGRICSFGNEIIFFAQNTLEVLSYDISNELFKKTILFSDKACDVAKVPFVIITPSGELVFSDMSTGELVYSDINFDKVERVSLECEDFSYVINNGLLFERNAYSIANYLNGLIFDDMEN